MAVETIPLYFESSWSILSTIGMVNTMFGLLVIGITGYSPLAMVPLVCSVAGAVANGLCFYALYEIHPTKSLLIGAIFADLFWLIQEAGLSFYSYMILRRVLRNRQRVLFLCSFWCLMICIVVLRMSILVTRARNFLAGNDDQNLQDLVAHLHIGYFISLAFVEILSAFFLIRIFSQAKRGSDEVASRGGLFHYLTQSTEIRLATLAVIGVTRAITYSFQKTVHASDVTGQVDRFVFTLECLFPIIMFIDILASRIASVTRSNAASTHTGANSRNVFQRSRADHNIRMYSMTAQNKGKLNDFSSSQERIVGDADDSGVKITGGREYEEKPSEMSPENTINKTVEFQFRESAA